MKYRKKPVVIEAWQFGDENMPKEFLAQIKTETETVSGEGVFMRFFIETLEGNHRVKAGDYIIKGVKGEFYPCKADIFEMTYEEI